MWPRPPSSKSQLSQFCDQYRRLFLTFETTSARSAAGIRAVILDYGEVLCHLPTPENIELLARIFQVDSQSFLPMYLKTRIPYDRGDLLPAAYWRNFARQAGVTVDEKVIEQLRQVDKDMWSRPNEPMIQWLQRIHAAGFKTAILSNMPTDMADHVRETFPWLAEFDQHIFSAEVRSAKPEPAIYRHAIEALDVAPLEALFIDDREENLAGARAIGIRGIRYRTVEHLREDLRAIGFPLLPDASV
jgi:putative hydrolase of the HAD superfamily